MLVWEEGVDGCWQVKERGRVDICYSFCPLTGWIMPLRVCAYSLRHARLCEAP